MAQTTVDIAVCPFTIVVDTQERGAAYTFDQIQGMGATVGRMLIVKTVMRHLKTGDYSIEGFEDRVTIERKTLSDLYKTLGQGRERFEREFQRMQAMEFAAVVVEADLREVWRPAEFYPDWQSRLNPKSVEGTIVAWSIRYPRVHWWTVGGRRAGELRAFGVLIKFWEATQRGQNETKKNP